MKKRGKGFSTIGYANGFYGGGDPNQSQISLKLDGTFDLLMGTAELGQGCNTAFAQIAAESLDVPPDCITVTNGDTDVIPFCMGAFASRALFIGGNAVISACDDLKEKIKQFAAPMLEVAPEQLVVADNKVSVEDNAEKSLAMADIGGASTFGGGYLVGLGVYMPPGPLESDPKTGYMPLLSAAPFAACIVEIEVDTGTGIIEVLSINHAYEIGKAISPIICKQQINGGTAMGIGMALSESAHPSWPSMDNAVDKLADYYMATAADMPAQDHYATVEVPHPDGPFGAKGFCEMSCNAQLPAIAMAVHDAIGVWITKFPITPEDILRALAPNEEGV